MVKHPLLFIVYGLKYASLTVGKANPGYRTPLQGDRGSCRDGAGCPTAGDGFIARVMLPIFCRGKEKRSIIFM